MSARLDIAAQAKAWNRKRIASGDVVLLYCELWAMPALGTAEEDDDWDAVDRAGSLRAEDGFIIVRMAANHYPHPLNSALLDAALPLLQQHVNRWCLGGVVTEGLPFDVVEGVIKKIMGSLERDVIGDVRKHLHAIEALQALLEGIS